MNLVNITIRKHYYINQKGNTGFCFAQVIGWQKNRHWGFEAGAELCRKIMTVDFATVKIFLRYAKKMQVAYQPIIAQFLIYQHPRRVVFTAGQKKLKFFSFFFASIKPLHLIFIRSN